MHNLHQKLQLFAQHVPLEYPASKEIYLRERETDWWIGYEKSFKYNNETYLNTIYYKKRLCTNEKDPHLLTTKIKSRGQLLKEKALIKRSNVKVHLNIARMKVKVNLHLVRMHPDQARNLQNMKIKFHQI